MSSSTPPSDWPRLLSLTVHEFRTPMTIVAGYIRMLLRDKAGALSADQRRLLEEAEKSCGRLSGLVAELSDLGRLEEGRATFNRGSVNVSALVDEAAASLEGALDRELAIVVRSDGVDVHVNGDATRLRDAIRGVLHALVRETVLSPEFVVDRRYGNMDGKRGIRILAGEPLVIQAVERDDAQLSRFDEWRGGSGLTLPIARRVIEAHGGRLEAPSGDLARSGAVIFLPESTERSAAVP